MTIIIARTAATKIFKKEINIIRIIRGDRGLIILKAIVTVFLKTSKAMAQTFKERSRVDRTLEFRASQTMKASNPTYSKS